jgi:hypothetical protein
VVKVASGDGRSGRSARRRSVDRGAAMGSMKRRTRRGSVAQAATVVQKGAARSETDPGSVAVALGRAQFGVQFFSNYSKIAQIL